MNGERNPRRSVAVRVAMVLLVAVASAVAGEGTNSSTGGWIAGAEKADDTHKLAVGDKISFRIVEDDDDTKSITVSDAGEVDVPYLGRVAAEHKTCRELTREIKAALEKDYYYHATVVIGVDSFSKTMGKIYVAGAVRSPGPLDIPGDETLTLSKAVLRAGGFGEFADERHVKLTRKQSGGDFQSTTVDVGSLIEKGKTGTDIAIEAGDVIYVPEKTVRF